MSGSLKLFKFFNRCWHERCPVSNRYRSVLIEFLILLVPIRTGYMPEQKLGTGRYWVTRKNYTCCGLSSVLSNDISNTDTSNSRRPNRSEPIRLEETISCR